MSADATDPAGSRARRYCFYVGKFLLQSLTQSSLGYFTVWEFTGRTAGRELDEHGGSSGACSEAELRAWSGIVRNFHRR